MNLKDLKKKIEMKYAEGTVNLEGGETQVLKFPLLTVGDWGELKDNTGVDIWDLLLSVSSGTDEAKVSKMTKAEIEEMQKESSFNLLKKVDQKTQVLMIYYSLRRVHEDVDPETVDYIITYGMDKSEYIQVVNFLLYGVTAEQVSKMQKESELKNVPKAKKTKAKPTAIEAEE